jgi:hypothetical protein
LADPATRRQFDELARAYDSNADLYLVRKAAFRLRKSRRLQPELITRIADWEREVKTISIRELAEQPLMVPPQPGIYIFHDPDGYLYVGQSDNLQRRLAEHLDQSSNLDLEKFLTGSRLAKDKTFVEIHVFPLDSRAKDITVRRAYESELIRSRKPKYNVLP